jgi:HEAT repeat protein
MKKSILLSILLGFGMVTAGWASGLSKPAIQALMKALQDSNLEVRTAAAQAFSEVPDAAEQAVKPLESALIASADAAEQDALVKALVAANEGSTPKRLTAALSNPQFTWGAGAKAKAVTVVGKIGRKDMVGWLTNVVAGEQEPEIRAAAARALGQMGAPPKKEKSD